MHYLIIENEQVEELTYNVVGFLWDNGNEVSIQKRYTNNDKYLLEADCVVSLENKCFSMDNLAKSKLFLRFCSDGVYSNVIPSPYRIFEYKVLNKHTLAAFFSWCKKLNLFKGK